MGTHCSKLCLPPSTVGTSNDTGDNRSMALQEREIHRWAFAASDPVVRLYDARKDAFLLKPPSEISSTVVTVKSLNTPIVCTGKVKEENLRELMKIDADSYLNVCLNITNPHGVTSMINEIFIIDEYTRYLLYYQETQQMKFNDKPIIDKSKRLKRYFRESDATHVLTKMKCGIQVLVLFQVVPGQIDAFDQLLERTRSRFAAQTFNLESPDQDLFEKSSKIKVFSNTTDPAQLTNLPAICETLANLRVATVQQCPMEYTFQPLSFLFPWYCSEKAEYHPINELVMKQIEIHVNKVLLSWKQLNVPLDSTIEETMRKHIKRQLEDIQKQQPSLDEAYSMNINKLRQIVLDIRHGNIDNNFLLSDAFVDTEVLTKAVEQRNKLIEKAKFIQSFEEQNIKYWNVAMYISQSDMELEVVEQKLCKMANRVRVFCFNDELKEKFSSKWEEYHRQLIDRQNGDDVIYADFSFTSLKLSKMKILDSSGIYRQKKKTLEEGDSDTKPSVNKKVRSELKTNHPMEKVILLLGESGSGKSTFINAVVNYFHFHTLDEALSQKPIALIPISFIITEGDDFQERLLTFGEQDSNEDNRHLGQSVTQQCRSYVFSRDEHTKIRLIDTPGMGDTRGIDQDDTNMQHILSFVSNLSHIDAICILLKPDQARLNVVLRSYFSRLVGFLGAKVHENIVFCFTHTRSTFYSPGNTGPLLRQMLQTEKSEIPFQKNNTFCFDSESFRYLVAKTHGIRFDKFLTEECKKSWSKSETESHRLIQYVCTSLQPCLKDDWRSVEHAQFEVKRMARPVLETIRNIARNIILILQNNSSQSLIEIYAQSVVENATICPISHRQMKIIHGLWILETESCDFFDHCSKCSCAHSEHSKIDYELKYKKWKNGTNKPTVDELKASQNRLWETVMMFGRFVKDTGSLSKNNDALYIIFKQMIAEEEYICSQKTPHELNDRLCQELKRLKKTYSQQWQYSTSTAETTSLSIIYDQIKIARGNSDVATQLDAIRETKAKQMSVQEKYVSIVENGPSCF
ncbi:unnamed protein product [Adineta ricciae]|uniref:Uncharacterized protein n=1 Tax=Adineta ricciae TaxID=249248 RepID=A0A815IB33_ADIRI|nr:unnamed protein product [Adineta ricciae]